MAAGGDAGPFVGAHGDEKKMKEGKGGRAKGKRQRAKGERQRGKGKGQRGKGKGQMGKGSGGDGGSGRRVGEGLGLGGAAEDETAVSFAGELPTLSGHGLDEVMTFAGVDGGGGDDVFVGAAAIR